MSQKIDPLALLFDDDEINLNTISSIIKQKSNLSPHHKLDNISELKASDTNKIIFIDVIEEKLSLEETEPYFSSYKKYVDDFVDSKIKIEPILSTTSFQYTVYPIKYQAIFDNYKNQLKLNWTVNEVPLAKDVNDWTNKLSQDDRNFIMHILAFFSAADGIVNCNIRKNLIDQITIKEAEMAYGKQFEMENCHGEMYSLMLDTFVKDLTLKNKLINSIKTMPTMKKKADWCHKWIDSDKPFAHKIAAFAIVEGVFFSGSFASIFWLKTREGHIMPGLRKSNKFIARDEHQHVLLACLIFSELKNRLKQSVFYEMIHEAVKIEEEFINSALPCRLLGMNAELMTHYIEYVADKLLSQFGYQKTFHTENPFEFMKKIDTFVKANFFEESNDAYSSGTIDNPRVFKILQKF